MVSFSERFTESVFAARFLKSIIIIANITNTTKLITNPQISKLKFSISLPSQFENETLFILNVKNPYANALKFSAFALTLFHFVTLKKLPVLINIYLAIYYDEHKMEKIENVIQFLNNCGLSVTTAESCTAGLVAAMMADVSGCGESLQSGYVVYTEEAKHNCLGVSLETMQTFGLTSEEVAREMAIGAFNRSSADIVLAITGKAESNDDLNGVVCFAYVLRTSNGYRLLSESKSFSGSRNEVRNEAARYALLSLPEIYKKIQTYPEVLLP